MRPLLPHAPEPPQARTNPLLSFRRLSIVLQAVKEGTSVCGGDLAGYPSRPSPGQQLHSINLTLPLCSSFDRSQKYSSTGVRFAHSVLDRGGGPITATIWDPPPASRVQTRAYIYLRKESVTFLSETSLLTQYTVRSTWTMLSPGRDSRY